MRYTLLIVAAALLLPIAPVSAAGAKVAQDSVEPVGKNKNLPRPRRPRVGNNSNFLPIFAGVLAAAAGVGGGIALIPGGQPVSP